MIFVTVGTHEQPFDRLLRWVDELVGAGLLQEQVVMQTGYSDYQPRFCQHQPFFSFEEMQQLYQEAEAVVCHGGPATLVNVLLTGKRPVVVPRLKCFGEHVNDHQRAFAQRLVVENEPVVVIGGEERQRLLEALLAKPVCEKKSLGRDFVTQLDPLIRQMLGDPWRVS